MAIENPGNLGFGNWGETDNNRTRNLGNEHGKSQVKTMHLSGQPEKHGVVHPLAEGQGVELPSEVLGVCVTGHADHAKRELDDGV